MSIADIKEMPVQERVYLMEQIWDSLKSEEEQLSSPVWHKDILEQRREAHSKGDVKSYSVEEVRQLLK